MRNKRTFDTPTNLIHLVERCANPACGCQFWPNGKGGQRGRYCCDACRQSAYRTRRALAKGAKLVQGIRDELNRNKATGHNCPHCRQPLEQDVDGDWTCADCLYVEVTP